MPEEKEKTLKVEEITDEMRHNARRKIDFAKAKLVIEQAFFGVLMAQISVLEDDTLKPATAGTDGVRIWYHPKFISELRADEVRSVLMHEVFHIIYLHCSQQRRQTRDRHKWNISTDYAINIELNDMSYRLPKAEDPNDPDAHDILYSDEFRKMTAEDIYAAIPDKEADKKKTFDCHRFELASSSDLDDMVDTICISADIAKQQNKWGNVPDGIKRFVEKLKKPKVPWQRLFHRYIGDSLERNDYSFIRPNRRFNNPVMWEIMGRKVIVPSLKNRVLGRVFVAVDTSGSIDKNDLSDFVTEMSKISHLVNEVTVITCDATVHEVVRVHSFSEMLKKVHFEGGGGTNFVPVFDKIKELNEVPELLVFLTDGWGEFPKVPPKDYDVIWVLTKGGHTPPWGKVVELPQAQEDNIRL